jgi:hypothetical protein
MAHMLEHANGNNGIKLLLNLPVILQAYFNG